MEYGATRLAQIRDAAQARDAAQIRGTAQVRIWRIYSDTMGNGAGRRQKDIGDYDRDGMTELVEDGEVYTTSC